MVPTSYTVEEAVRFLRNEVILESANSLGWTDTVPAFVATPEVKTVDAFTDDTITVTATIHDIPLGSVLVFEDGFFRTTKAFVPVGETTISFTPDLDTEDPEDKKVLIRYSESQPAVPNPKFVAVVDEALRQLGLENIEQINPSNIRAFRILARMELLRRITENRVPRYDKTITWYDDDRNFGPRDIQRDTPSITNNQLLALYNREVTALSSELNPVDNTIPVPVSGIPAESLSQSSGVVIKW